MVIGEVKRGVVWPDALTQARRYTSAIESGWGDGEGEAAVFTTFVGGQANRTWDAVPGATDGCVRMAQSRKRERFVCVPIGIRPGGLELEARRALQFRAYDPLTGKGAGVWTLRAGKRCRLPAGAGGWLLVGRLRR